MTTLVRTAGMARGTADWQLDQMRENENARIWESQQRTDEAWQVVSRLERAFNALLSAESRLCDAMAYAEGTEAEDKIQKILDSMELLECDIRRLKEGI